MGRREHWGGGGQYWGRSEGILGSYHSYEGRPV